jgi:hypothetical protein
VIPLTREDVAVGLGGRGSAHSDRAVPPTLPSATGSRWVVLRCQLLIGLLEFKFDRLNMNLAI